MPYDDRYYHRHRQEYHEWEKRLAKDFFGRYRVKSVVDLGCGIGSYLDAAFDLSLSPIKGYEINLAAANRYIPEHLKPFISADDVTKELPKAAFDCAWSVEVGEHLQPAGTLPFVNNLVGLAERLILLTCAPPGQGGTSHINLRPKEEWISLVRQNGAEYLPKEVERTVRIWATLGAPGYILRNLMIFIKI